jgi:hypothetical protein
MENELGEEVDLNRLWWDMRNSLGLSLWDNLHYSLLNILRGRLPNSLLDSLRGSLNERNGREGR